MSLRRDKRGQMGGAKEAVTLVIAISVLVLMAAFLIPVAIDEIEGDTEVTLTQENETLTEVNAELDSNASISSGSVDLTLTSDGTSTTKTISSGAEATYTLDRGDVVAGVESTDVAASPSTATINYTYNRDFAFSDASRSIWTIIPLMIVLAVFLAVIGAALTRSDVGPG